jgi:hypothetical protein
MTKTTSARIAGFTFLAYIAATLASMAIYTRAAGGMDTAAKLAAISEHVLEMRVLVVLALVQGLAALVLAVTLYAVTRDEDRDLAMLAMVCRVAEGVIGGLSASTTLALLWVATASGPDALDADAARALGGYLLRDDGAVGAMFFAVGSALFAYLLWRGRLVPTALACLGLAASILLVVGLPAQLLNLISPSVASLMWLPALAYEIPLGLWLLIKGVRPSVAPVSR